MSGLSKKGTYNYMAPEVYRGGAYGFSVDLYSLGLVLYRLLNKNRTPFLPPPPEPISFRDREQALARRMSGEALPSPYYGEGRQPRYGRRFHHGSRIRTRGINLLYRYGTLLK